MKDKTRTIIMNAILAAIYAALTLVLAPISYGPLQFRLAEILILLALLNSKFIPGLAVGCVIANLFSPMGIYDVFFGTIGTVVASLALWGIGRKVQKIIPALILSVFAASLSNGIFVGAEIYLTTQMSFFLYGGYVFLSELVVLLAGAFLYYILEKHQVLQRLLR